MKKLFLFFAFATIFGGISIECKAQCTYSISPKSQSFGIEGGSGTIQVTTDSACFWGAVHGDSWITISSSTGLNTGSGSITYTVDPNNELVPRLGTISIVLEGQPTQTFSITQFGSIASLAGTWDFTIDYGRHITPMLVDSSGNFSGIVISYLTDCNTARFDAIKGTFSVTDSENAAVAFTLTTLSGVCPGQGASGGGAGSLYTPLGFVSSNYTDIEIHPIGNDTEIWPWSAYKDTSSSKSHDSTSFAIKLLDPVPNLVDNTGALMTDASKIMTLGISRKGAVADSVTQLYVTIQTGKPVTISIAGGSQGEADGYFTKLGDNTHGSTFDITPLVANVTDTEAIVVYHAPSNLGKNLVSSRDVVINVALTSEPSTIVSSSKISLTRPPVVLVHGMWSDPGVWDRGLFSSNLQPKGFRTFAADYSSDNASTFDPKSNPTGVAAIRRTVNIALDSLRNLGFAASRVDAVGHSLGGLMVRSFAQQSDYYSSANYLKGSIRRLITLGTPHQGSPFGPLLWNNRNVGVKFYGLPVTLSTILAFPGIGKPIGTCHRDFLYQAPIGSGYANLTACSIPTHVIVGIWSPDGLSDYNSIAALLSIFFETPSHLFGTTATDLIVAESSQKGGLTSPSFFDEYSDVIHSDVLRAAPLVGPFVGQYLSMPTEVSSTEIQNRVVQLLISDYTENLFWSLPKPQSIKPKGQDKPQSLPSDAPLANGSIQITAPMSGKAIHAGDSVTITVKSIGTDPLRNVLVWIPSIGMDSLPAQLPASMKVLMPADLPLGSMTVLALARDVDGGLLADTLSIQVEIPTNIVQPPSIIALLDVITIYPNPTTGIVSVQGAPSSDLNVSVLNLLGETVMELKNSHSSDFSLDLSKLLPGAYYIRFSSANSVITKKIIKN